MKFSSLVLSGLRHYWRTHLGVLAGMLIATATLVGALVVGDSVRYSLLRGALNRIGDVQHAMSTGDRFFQSELAVGLGAGSAPMVIISGVASSADGSRRLHDIQVLGVDERFFELAPGTTQAVPPAAGEAWVNPETARRLQLQAGDELVLRVELPSALPRDMALAPGDVAVALRLRVSGTLGAQDFSEFSLRGGSSARANVFVNLDWLQQELEIPGRANLMLSRGVDTQQLNQAIANSWGIADAELTLGNLADGRRELRTGRIFFDEPVLEVLESLDGVPLEGVFTYFVNGLRMGDDAIPYSMVSALGPLNDAARETPASESHLVSELEPNSLLLNEWAAEDLSAQVGESIELEFFVVDASRQLVEHKQSFRYAGQIPIEGLANDSGLMPDFPGLADSENCRDWEPGTPVDLDRIRDKDEVYWDEYGGTPKAFVHLQAGRDMWTSRFGALTAVRFPASKEAAVRAALRADLVPARLGLFFRDVRTPALAGGDTATDFGGLFIGLSFFLIVAAILLAVQLFLFGVEQRSNEIGLYAALGFSQRFIRRLLLSEVALLSIVGAGVGSVLGLVYTQLVLYGLSNAWSGAIASVSVTFHANPSTVILGFAISVLASLATGRYALRKAQGVQASLLLNGASALGDEACAQAPSAQRRTLLLSGLGIALALATAFLVDPSGGPSAAGAFFGAGALALTSLLFLCRVLLRPAHQGQPALLGSLSGFGRRNSTRRPGRSLATISLMAIGTFLVVAVGANRLGPTQNPSLRSSGTGGFVLFGRSSLPIVHDLNSELGREKLGLDGPELAQVNIVPMRLLPGDDASCLNLARPQAPPLFGVRSVQLTERQAFSFASTSEDTETPWALLSKPLDDGAIPAIGDVTSLTWQLHMGVGDSLTYMDERGEEFEVRIVGALADSTLQGMLLIEESHFEARFPTQGGHRRFLIDAPADEIAEVSALLTRNMRDLGFAVEPSAERLDAFHAVQNTYLTIFQGLGGLGLLLGSVGLGMVLLRNTMERRSELALATALGFPARRVRLLVFSEYGYLLLLGLGTGGLAALVAILPAMRAPGSELSLSQFWILLGAVTCSSLFWLLLSTRVAVQRSPLAGLRED